MSVNYDNISGTAYEGILNPRPLPSRGEIYKKISAIMEDMQPVGKTGTNTQQGWKYRTIEEIKNVSNPAFRKHGVFYTPEVLEHQVVEEVTKQGTKMRKHTIKVRYRLFAEDGSFVESVVYGEAADSGDKGAGKAQTYAEKVMLIQVLNIPTKAQDEAQEDVEEDPDAHEYEFKAGMKSVLPPPQVSAKPAAKSSPGAKSGDFDPTSPPYREITFGKYKGMTFKQVDEAEIGAMEDWDDGKGYLGLVRSWDPSPWTDKFLFDADEYLKWRKKNRPMKDREPESLPSGHGNN